MATIIRMASDHLAIALDAIASMMKLPTGNADEFTPTAIARTAQYAHFTITAAEKGVREAMAKATAEEVEIITPIAERARIIQAEADGEAARIAGLPKLTRRRLAAIDIANPRPPSTPAEKTYEWITKAPAPPPPEPMESPVVARLNFTSKGGWQRVR